MFTTSFARCRWAAAVLLPLALAPAVAQQGERYRSPIVFQRFDNVAADPTVPGFYGGGEIWIMEDDGSRLQRFRSDPDRHLDHPSLTEDRAHVLYAEFEPGGNDPRAKARLMMESIGLRTDGNAVRRVVRNVPSCSVHHASISPVTQELTYSRYCGDAAVALITEKDFVIQDVSAAAEGLHAGNGVGLANGAVFQAEVARENGERRAAIAVVSFGAEDSISYREITDRRFLHRRPAVSPDGQWVAWQSNDSEAGTDDLFLARIDGSSSRRLTRSSANDGHPWFSRDARWIVFESDRTGSWEIFKIEVGSGEVVQLTDDPSKVSTRPRY